VSFNVGSLTIAAGTPDTFKAPSDGMKAIIIGNESGLTVTVTMESGHVQKTLYPGILDWFAVKKGFTGNIKLNPEAMLSNVALWPSSSLIFDAIGIRDPEEATMYPISLPRVTNTGNTVNTTGMSGTTFIQNDNNVAGTSIIEATVIGDGSSAVTLTNDAIMTLGDATHKGSLTTHGDTSLAETINFHNSNPVHIQQLNGADFIFESPANTEVGRLTNAGVLDLSAHPGSLKLGVGTLTKLSFFTVSLTTSADLYAHGLGVLPDIIVGVNDGTSSGANPFKYNKSGSNATNANLVATQNGTFYLLAMKF
jgi:hypothetical protein